MKKLMSFICCLIVSVAALAALPFDLEFGMDADDIRKTGIDFELEELDELGPFTLYHFEPDKKKSQTWYDVGCVLTEEDGLIGVFQIQGCPENSFNRRWNHTQRQIAKDYGEPLDMFRYAEDHPFNEDMFFLALIGGITDEELVRETGLSFLASLIVDENDDVSRIWVRDDGGIAAIAPKSRTEIVSLWIAPDVLAKVAGHVRILLLDELGGAF